MRRIIRFPVVIVALCFCAACTPSSESASEPAAGTTEPKVASEAVPVPADDAPPDDVSTTASTAPADPSEPATDDAPGTTEASGNAAADEPEEPAEPKEPAEPEQADETGDSPGDDPDEAVDDADDADLDDSSNDRVGTAPSPTRPGTVSGVRISGPGIVPSDCGADATGGSCTELECEIVTADAPCIPATNGHGPTEAVAIGEYQTGIFVPDGALVDVYFDQRRTLDEMEGLCRGMRGVFHVRGQDGSPWAGWGYCAGVDF